MSSRLRNPIGRVIAAVAALVLAAGVVIAAAQPAWAEGKQSRVTVNINPAPNSANRPSDATGYPTYNYWVMMWASIGSDGHVAYSVDKENLAKALGDLKIDGKSLFTVEAAGTGNWNIKLNKKDDTKGEEFSADEVVNALNSISDKDGVSEAHGTAQYDSGGTNASFTIDKNGYVLVTSTLGTKLVADTYGNKTINEKNVYPSSTKTQSTEQNGSYGSTDVSREVGGTVWYHIDITIPANANKQIQVFDTITKGLTLDKEITASATYGTPVSGLTWGNETTDQSTGSKSYNATIPAETVEALASAARNAEQSYTTLTLSYKATVNANAIDYNTQTHENNKAHIKYGNDFTTNDDEVDVYTYKFQLLKYDAATLDGREATAATPLGGAVFELYRKDETTPLKLVPTDQGNNPTHFRLAASSGESGAVTQFTTVDGVGNTLQISGLDKNTTYTLKEVKAPDGFNRLTEDVTIPTDTIRIGGVEPIENHYGTVLPSTGGAGTIAFYVIGGLLIVGAVVYLVHRKKSNANA